MRKALFAAGGASVLAGVALLSLGIASIPGNSRGRPEAKLVDLGTEEGIDYAFRRGIPATQTPAEAPSPRLPPLGAPPFRIEIEKIGVDAPVYEYGLDAENVPEVPKNPADVAWYDFSAQPGTGGNAVFAGHVTWNGPGVFYDLDKLQPGDSVRLRGANGAELLYRVSATFTVDPNDRDALKVMSPTGTDVITLITCSGTFFPADDPVAGGDYTLRLIVRAELQSAEPAG